MLVKKSRMERAHLESGDLKNRAKVATNPNTEHIKRKLEFGLGQPQYEEDPLEPAVKLKGCR
jgi:hypothetical protein